VALSYSRNRLKVEHERRNVWPILAVTAKNGPPQDQRRAIRSYISLKDLFFMPDRLVDQVRGVQNKRLDCASSGSPQETFGDKWEYSVSFRVKVRRL
jgi:hypothetical protein